MASLGNAALSVLENDYLTLQKKKKKKKKKQHPR